MLCNLTPLRNLSARLEVVILSDTPFRYEIAYRSNQPECLQRGGPRTSHVQPCDPAHRA